jgi:sulfatase modifying factor 1
VPGGTYYRTYDYGDVTSYADPATVSTFQLDKYLVTVSRFRQYVDYLTGPTGTPPTSGSGIHAHLNGGRGLANSAVGGEYETGWNAAWNTYIPTGAAAVTTWNASMVGCYGSDPGWNAPGSPGDPQPIGCVNVYQAYAFCIWDGGFLPSEAEWEYAAGGAQQLEYPWGSASPQAYSKYAIFDGCYLERPMNLYYCPGSEATVGPAAVGTATLGAGPWGHLDMAGEMFEWVLDAYAPYVDPCTDCAYLPVTPTSWVVRTEGWESAPVAGLTPPARTLATSVAGEGPASGFRCARMP